MLVNYLIALLPCICIINAFEPESIHDWMTEPELAYHFQTSDRKSVPVYELIYLPVLQDLNKIANVEALVEGDDEIDYSFSAFNQPINLKLKRNNGIFGSSFKSYFHDENGATLLNNSPENCHYLHRGLDSVAAVSICEPQRVQGLIFLNNSTYEIHPLSDRLQRLIKRDRVALHEDDLKTPHIIKRAQFSHDFEHNDVFPIAGNIFDSNEIIREAASNRPVGGMTVELALFFDEAAYKIFAPFMKYDTKKLQDMILAYMNGVQALYHHPSLGTTLELVLVRLDIMKTQAADMPHYDGERSKLLDSFCAYQADINPSDDATNPDHWDMALYVSGLDFYAYEKGRKSGVTMGLATVGGVCFDKYACVIAELGTTNVFGKPYPSAGFTSVYILAHEIGHNLGMHHDNSGNNCPKEGYIMSPSRGTNGETQWSTCSADIMSQLSWAKCLQDSAFPKKQMDHSKYLDSPGQIYTAKQQCEILLRDADALVAPNQQISTICYNLQCKTPNRSGYYFSGPALDGTSCGKKQYCFGGECVSKAPPKPVNKVVGGWSKWMEGKCSSGCLEKSQGFQTKRRFCNNPSPVNTDEGCEGSSVEFGLCKDDKYCKSKRLSVVDHASQKCKEFSRLLPELDPKGSGLQAPHEDARVWMGCAIFCRRADSGTFYTPRIELNDLGVSAYFPDGTWCHRAGSLNYYCLHHHCLPENFKFTKSVLLYGMGEDVPISQNAHPFDIVPPGMKSYLSLGSDGKALRTKLKPSDSKHRNEEGWETDDYVVVPGLRRSLENDVV